MPRTRFSLNSKAHQLDWIKTKKKKKIKKLLWANMNKQTLTTKNLATKFYE